MDKIEKALARLSKKERGRAYEVLKKILVRDFRGLDFKKLKDREDIYRVRKGDVRIIFRIAKSGEIFLLTIERRSDTTYRDF